MAFDLTDRGARGSKATPFTDPGGVITYKRRRRGGGDSDGTRSGGSEVEFTRSRHDVSTSNGSIDPDRISRIVNNWRNVLESSLQAEIGGDDVATSCIQKALICGPFGSFSQLNFGTEGSSRGHQNGELNANIVGNLPGCSLMPAKENSEPTLHGFDTGDQAGVNTAKCQDALCDILISEKFALLCDLLGSNFKSKDASSIIGLSLIFSKMKKGIYEHSTEFFHQDIQMMWEKFLRIGREMALLASSLSGISRDFYQRQHSTKESVLDTKHVDSNATTVLASHDSDPSTKAEPTNPSCLKVSTCQLCGLKDDRKRSLICDGCGVICHISCIEPPVLEMPRRNWYCAACSSSRDESVLPASTCGQQDHPHQNCMVCERLNGSVAPTRANKNNLDKVSMPSGSRECSVSSMEDDESTEPSRTAMMHLCKQCGTCEDEDKRFLICSNKHCLYKYYHIRCLKSTQLATKHQPPDRWYCPSCLCRGCLVDKDDDLICLCDACDEGYHIYCMNPPQTTVPKGTWYCLPCSMEKAKKGMRMYEQWVLQNHGGNGLKCDKPPEDVKPGRKATGSAGRKRNR